jgi:P27 family predicted phage terminase small subunit
MPTHLKVVTGNRGHRPLNENEPKPEAVAPDKPAHLSEVASRAWDATVAELSSIGVLARTDGMALEMLCEAYADHRSACEQIEQTALFVKSGLSNGDWSSCGRYYKTIGTVGAVMWRAHPAVAMKSDADRRIKAWFASFGLTPADRTRIQANVNPEAEDPSAKYFG